MNFKSFPRKALCSLTLVLFSAALLHGAAWSEEWRIALDASQDGAEAMHIAIEDLTEAGAKHGLAFAPAEKPEDAPENLLIVGAPARNALAAQWTAEGILKSRAPEDADGFTMETLTRDGCRILAIQGGSLIGDAYGLYWLIDRIQVHGRVPDLNVDPDPGHESAHGRSVGPPRIRRQFQGGDAEFASVFDQLGGRSRRPRFDPLGQCARAGV